MQFENKGKHNLPAGAELVAIGLLIDEAAGANFSEHLRDGLKLQPEPRIAEPLAGSELTIFNGDVTIQTFSTNDPARSPIAFT